MAKIFGKWLRYMGQGFSFEKRLYYVGNCLRNCFTMLAKIFGKWLRYMALLCWIWLMNLTNGLNMWEMTYICLKGIKYFRNG